MRRISIIYFLLLFLVFCHFPKVQAQSGFSKLFEYSINTVNYGHMITYIVYDSTTNEVFFPLNCVTSINGKWLNYNAFTKIDTFGNILKQVPIFDSFMNLSHESIVLTKDRQFLYWGGTAHDADVNDSTTMDYFITKTDLDLNVIWQKRYKNYGIQNATLRAGTEDSDGNITFIGRRFNYSGGYYPPVESKFILFKIDESGNLLWMNKLGQNSTNNMLGWHSGSDLFQNEDNTYFAYGMTYSYGATDYSPVIFKADADGNELWHRIYMPNYPTGSFGASTPVKSINKSFVNAGYVVGSQRHAFANCVDENGNELWNKVFDSEPNGIFRHVVNSNESTDLVMIGFCWVNDPAGRPSTMPAGYIVKVDTSGNEIWSRKFLYEFKRGLDHYLYKGITLNSGSIIAVGSAPDTFATGLTYSHGWVLKIDKNGCLNNDCSDVLGLEDVQLSKDSVRLYPNPTSGKFTVQQKRPFSKGTQLSILDMTGRKIQQLPSPENRNLMEYDISNLKPNLYILQIQNNTSTKHIKLDLIK